LYGDPFSLFDWCSSGHFALGQNRSQHSTHIYLHAFFDDQLVDDAVLPNLHIDLTLLRSDHGNGLASGYLVTRFDHPLK
jgi:hypothetical protein